MLFFESISLLNVMRQKAFMKLSMHKLCRTFNRNENVAKLLLHSEAKRKFSSKTKISMQTLVRNGKKTRKLYVVAFSRFWTQMTLRYDFEFELRQEIDIGAQSPYCIRKSDFKRQKSIYNARFLQPLNIFTNRLRLKRRHVIYN